MSLRKKEKRRRGGKNTLFRECWPIQACKGVAGLPVDEKQNAALKQLFDEMGIVSNYIKIDCQTKIRNGNKELDCTLLHKRNELDLGIK